MTTGRSRPRASRDRERRTQVVVVGAGNAALCAAIAAKQRGAQVTVLEKAPYEYRGGNSTQTLLFRFAYDSVEDLVPLVNDITREEVQSILDKLPKYTQADYYDDLMKVTEGRSDPELAQTLVSESLATVRWMRSVGHEWVPAPPDPIHPEALDINGGGVGLQERAFGIAERLGIAIDYETRAMVLLQDGDGRVVGVRALTPGGFVNYRAGAVVLACGGFEANAEMRARYLGPGWDTVKVRGVPFNTGDGLRMALEVGALPYGSWSSCHASPQDLNHPPYALPGYKRVGDWERYSYPFGITVNVQGKRFVDEGETVWHLTYAKMGREVVKQPGGVAFQVFDARARERNLIVWYEKARGAMTNSLGELAVQLGINREGFLETVREYNGAIQPGEFHQYKALGPSTVGIAPPKSNWALPIDKPPFEGFPVVCGITFTFGGLKIDEQARVVHTLDRPIPGLYTAGEMVGGLFHWNYPGGAGLMSGAVFGRRAGSHAAECALSR